MNNNNVTVNRRVRLDNTMVTESPELNIPSAEKILAVTANCRILGTESLIGEAKVSGRLFVRAIFLDSEGTPDSAEKVLEFTASISAPKLQPSCKAFVSGRVADIVYDGVQSLSIKVSCELGGYFIDESVLSILECTESDILCLSRDLNAETIRPLSDAVIQAAQNFDSKKPIAKILSYRSDANLESVTPSAGQYQIEGEILTSIVGLDGENNLFSQTFILPFAGEFSESAMTDVSEIIAEAIIKSTTVTVESEGSESLIIEVELGISGCYINPAVFSGIVDAYSISKELMLKTQDIDLVTSKCYRRIRERISGSESVQGTIKNIECVLSPSAGSVKAMTNFALTVEGVASATVLYSTHEGTLGSITVEVPYQIEVDGKYDCDIDFMPTAIITGVNAKITGASEVEVSFDLAITVYGVKSEEASLVESITYGADKEMGDVAISLYIAAPDESLWNIAKQLSTDEDTLIRLNPEIDLPLKGGEKILLYRSLG